MEKQFFDWDTWDVLDEGIFQFEGVTFTRDVGRFKMGDRIQYAVMDYTHGIVAFGSAGKEWKYRLFLSIGEEVHDEHPPKEEEEKLQ